MVCFSSFAQKQLLLNNAIQVSKNKNVLSSVAPENANNTHIETVSEKNYILNANDLFTITFNVDLINMSPFIDPEIDVIYITGSMFDWIIPGADPENQEMKRINNTMIWTKTMQLQAGTYGYMYFLNAGWDGVEWPGGVTRAIDVVEDAVINNTWETPHCTATFYVKDKDGFPIENASITLNNWRERTTDENGYTIFGMYGGSHSYDVSAEGYNSYSDVFEIECGENLTFSINMVFVHSEIEKYPAIEFFPNPAKDYLKIEFQTLMEKRVSIYNLFGTRLIHLNTNSHNIEINTSNLPIGVYLIKVKTNNGWFVEKFIKN
jgi:hypothetical protein